MIAARTFITSRYRHSAAVWGDSMYIFGGVDKDSERFSDLLKFDLEKESWKRIIPVNAGPSARTFHKSVIIDGKFYILGGKKIFFK